jgi:Tfp pilus assembly protein PilF
LLRLRQGKDQEAEQDFKKAFELDEQLKPEVEKLANEIRQKRKSN